jgi:hypothetical protein
MIHFFHPGSVKRVPGRRIFALEVAPDHGLRIIPPRRATAGSFMTLCSNFWYRATKARDFRNIPGIAGGSSTGEGDFGRGLRRRHH